MKKALLIVLYLNLIGTLKSQTPSNLWSPQAIGLLPQNYVVLAMSIVNKDVVWAIADSAYVNPLPSNFSVKVLKTINGGTTWQVQSVVAAEGRLGLDIHAVDASVAWITVQKPASATNNEVFKTTDGGATWTSKFNHYAASLFVRFFDTQKGFIWNRHAFASTQDGGNSWNPITITGWLNTEGVEIAGTTNICITIGDTIMGGTSASRICMSPDRGATWKFQDLRPISFFGEQVAILSLAFKDARNGIALGWNRNNFNSYLAKTTDGGTTWAYMTTYPFTVGSAIEYIRGTSNSYALTDNDGLTAYTTNGGQSWVKIDSTRSHCIRFLDRQTGWIGVAYNTANAPSFYKWNGGNLLSSIKVLDAEEIGLKISPNPTSRYLTVTYADDFQPTDLTIYTAVGKTVFQKNNLIQFSQSIDLQGFANGVYIVQLKNREGIVAKKIVLQR